MLRALALASVLVAGQAHAGLRGTLSFESCKLTSRQGALAREAECATFDVAENPALPDGRRLSLAVALVPSLSRTPQPDPVVLLAGGPGQSARDAFVAAAPAFEPLLRERHVLLVDQRGTGGSNPLRCPFPDWKTNAELGVGQARQLALDCRRTLEPLADLRFYTTGDYVRDLEAVRVALGVAQFNLAGGSYGTRVALEYLRRHPDAIRTVFLDSVVPPGLPLLQDHARNLDEALGHLSARCRDDAACRQRYGDPLATLRDLQRRLRREPVVAAFHHPVTHARLSALLTDDVLELVVRILSYSPDLTSLLPLLVDEAAHGRPQPLLAQAERLVSWASDALAHGMELSVICAEDEPRLRARPNDVTTVLGATLVEYTRAQCSAWPRGAVPADFGAPVISGKPVLLLSGEFDPVTPPRYAEEVARTLSNSRSLVARGQGHTPMGQGCMPKVLREFVRRADPRALDADCLKALGAAPFFLNPSGPAP